MVLVDIVLPWVGRDAVVSNEISLLFPNVFSTFVFHTIYMENKCLIGVL